MNHHEARQSARLAWRLTACAAVACSLGACATGSSSSFTQAPIFFSSGDGAITDSSGELVALANGDFANGVPQFSAVAGNSVLPVNAATPLALGAEADLGPITNASVSLSAQTSSLSIVANTPLAGLDAGLTPSGANLSTAAPLLGPAATPLTASIALPAVVNSTASAAGGALPTRGTILAAGGVASAAAAGGVSSVSALLSTVATQQQKVRICGLKPTC